MTLPDPSIYGQPPQNGPGFSGGSLPRIPAGTPGISGAAPAFDPKDPSTWPAGFLPKRGQEVPGAADWNAGAAGNKPWLTHVEAAAETRNNFYYGGSAGAADAFNSKVQGTQDALNGGFAGAQNTAIGLQGAANARAPGQFLDQSGIANNGYDRGQQGKTMAQLQDFAAQGPGPSAAQATLAQATNANQANELALARSGRGMGQSQSGLRQAMAQNAGIQQSSANQAAILNAQETQQWRQNQLNAYGHIGNIAGQARQGDLGQASYVTGSQQAGQNANDQASLGYGNEAIGSLSGAGSVNANLFNTQNAVNQSALSGNQNFENNVLNYWEGTKGTTGGTDYSPYLAAGGAIVGGLVGGPGGAVVGGAAGGAAGRAL